MMTDRHHLYGKFNLYFRFPVIRNVFDARQRRFATARHLSVRPNDSLRLLTPGGPESVIEERELKDETSC